MEDEELINAIKELRNNPTVGLKQYLDLLGYRVLSAPKGTLSAGASIEIPLADDNVMLHSISLTGTGTMQLEFNTNMSNVFTVGSTGKVWNWSNVDKIFKGNGFKIKLTNNGSTSIKYYLIIDYSFITANALREIKRVVL